jgi:hypothetical protein
VRRDAVKQVNSALTVVVNAQADVQRTINPRGQWHNRPESRRSAPTSTTQHESAFLFFTDGDRFVSWWSALPVVVMRLCARDEANKFLFQHLK